MTTPANLAGAMEAAAQASGRAARQAFVVGERAYTHADVHAGAAGAASLLAQRRVRGGDRVVLALPDGIEMAWALLAALRLGAIAVPVNPRLTADEHRYMAVDSGARLAVCEPLLADHFVPRLEVVTAAEIAAAATAGPLHPVVPVGADAPAYAQYTSGTTGPPKAALHRHGDPLVYVDAFARGAIDMRADDVVLSVSKMFFAYGLGNSLFFPLLTGACAVLHGGPAGPADVARLAEANAVTVLFAVPTFYARLAANAALAPSFASLRVAVSAGETLTVGLHRRAQELLACPILDGLGSTEVGQTFTSNTLHQRKEGTVGVALPPYDVTVRDDSGSEVAPGVVGALWVRGPTIMVEYLCDPEATSAATVGPWLRTADRAAVDAEGFVHHLGRTDDIEMVGGMCVWPVEIEEVLGAHQGVAEVAVAGVRDADGASHLEAFVVPAEGRARRDPLAAQLLELARTRLAPHKVPRRVNLVPSLPRTPTGKLRRFVLRSGGAAAPGGPVTPAAR